MQTNTEMKTSSSTKAVSKYFPGKNAYRDHINEKVKDFHMVMKINSLFYSMNKGFVPKIKLPNTNEEVEFTKQDMKRLIVWFDNELLDTDKWYQAALKRKKPKKNPGAFKQLTRHTEACINYFSEVINSNEKLKCLSNLKFLTTGNTLRGIAPANMITQLISTIIIVLDCQNPADRQLIIIDPIMKKYFKAEIDIALKKQYEKEKEKIVKLKEDNLLIDKENLDIVERNKTATKQEQLKKLKNIPIEDSIRYPNMLRHPYMQTIISAHRTNQKMEDPEMIKFLQNTALVAASSEDLKIVSDFRELVQGSREDVKKTNKKSKKEETTISAVL